MDPTSVVVGLCNIVCGLVFTLLGSILAAVRIPMNSWYGFKIRHALASAENWERVNRFGGQRLVIWGLPLILTGIICVFLAFPHPDSWMAPVGLLPIFVFVMVPILETIMFARRLPPADAGKAGSQPTLAAPTH